MKQRNDALSLDNRRSPTAASAPVPIVQTEGLGNPVLDWDLPDPGVLKVEDTYYVYATNSSGRHIQVAQSADLLQWQVLGDALPILPVWSIQKFGWNWAPAVMATPDGYIMYLSARCRCGTREMQCIATATSDRPDGGFESFTEAPLICQTEEGGSIDPSIFLDEDGSCYLLWKSDANSIGRHTWIYIQELARDGLTLLGTPKRLITNDQAWEGHLVEGPTLTKHAGKYYLFYSGNNFTNTRYAIGYAVADQLTGPYRKSTRPWLATDTSRGLKGPGGQDITVGPDGSTWLVFHAWSGDCRSLNVGRLTWQEII